MGSGTCSGKVVGGNEKVDSCLSLAHREALLAEMGVAVREDGGTVGVFSPKKVCEGLDKEAWRALWMPEEEGWMWAVWWAH